MKLTPARLLAFEILTAVDGGGYASDLLAARAAPLEARDAGLAWEIVLGVLGYQLQLDYLIEHYSGKPAVRLDVPVRIALRMAVYQLRYLDRIPAHAAVSESVDLIKRARKRSAAGFANAILRKVDRDPVAWPSAAIQFSHPQWLLDRRQRYRGRIGRGHRARQPAGAEDLYQSGYGPHSGHRRAIHCPAAADRTGHDHAGSVRRAGQ